MAVLNYKEIMNMKECVIISKGDIQFSKSVQDNIEYTKIKGIGNINF